MGDSRDGFTFNDDGTSRGVKAPKKVKVVVTTSPLGEIDGLPQVGKLKRNTKYKITAKEVR